MSNNCKIRIVSTGQSIDISNGRNSEKITTGILSSTYNEYKGHFIYLSSRGPEFRPRVSHEPEPTCFFPSVYVILACFSASSPLSSASVCFGGWAPSCWMR